MSEPSAEQTSVSFSPSRLAMLSVVLFLVCFIGLVFARGMSPGQWEFGLEVATEVAAIEFQPGADTRWRVDRAVICSREPLSLPDRYSIADAGAVCGGRRWAGWEIAEPEQVLSIRGGATAMLEVSDEQLQMSLRAAAGSVGEFAVIGLVDSVPLGSAVNLFWDLSNETDALSFPFIGATTLGRAVNWSDAGMLRSGSVAVFTADESADSRTQVDQADLMLGDQVRLGGGAGDVWPKGFVRAGDADMLQIVAFGRADSLSIERFGDSGYDFRPGWMARLFSDPLITFWGSLLLVYISVVLSVVPLLEGRTPRSVPNRFRRVRWLMRHRE